MEFTYTREDFNTTAPYEYITKIEDPFQQGVAERELEEYARSVGFKSFKSALRQYRKSLKDASESALYKPDEITAFDDQNLELDTGEWIANDSGVYKYGGMSGGIEVACTHPIMPVERLRNIDTGELKVRLAFRRGKKGRKTWNEILTDFDTVSNAKNIVALSRINISVTSGKRAQNLVDYLSDVMDRNYDIIPERKTVSRLGWNEEGFAPYIGDIIFDGNPDFSRTFAAIKPHGSADEWIKEARAVRSFNLAARIVLATSFASVLVGPLGCSPFFVHLWGIASETGKTVSQLVAASVWGEPTRGGEYFKTFKSTSVGLEIMAGFLNSLPLIMDELQLTKDGKGKINFNVYELESGSGKLRATRTLGLATTPRWANCFITSGETPITSELDGAGALNRVIEIECVEGVKLIEDGHRTAECFKKNYGHAGKMFVEKLVDPENMDLARCRYAGLYEDFLKLKATEKQSHSAALITLADELATEWIFKDGNGLTVPQVAEFLKSSEAVSTGERGYNFLCDWVAQNANKLCGTSDVFEVYGDIGSGEDEGYVYIVRSVFNRVCTENGLSSAAILSYLKSTGLIKTRGKAMTKCKRINKIQTECIILKLNSSEWEEIGDDTPVPFTAEP